MRFRFVAARLTTITLAALLLVAAPSSRAQSSDLRRPNAGDPAEELAVRFPYGEGVLVSTARVSTSQAYREVERFRPLSDTAALPALTGLLLGALFCFSARQHRSRRSPNPSLRFAGPRAPPPLQLA
jgi:hypothetical protein